MARSQTGFLLLLGFAGFVSTGCKSLVEVDVQCPRLCLAAPGPSLPGSASLLPSRFDVDASGLPSWDAGTVLDASPVPDAPTVQPSMQWDTILRFNDVIDQLPSTAVSISLDVRLTSVTLSSTRDLSFITDLRVFLTHVQAPVDGGRTSTSISSCWDRISSNPIASYQSQAAPIGPTIDLVNLVPTINLFDCIKDRPAKLVVDMGIEPSMYPPLDVPMTLSTCVGAQSTTSYP